MVTTASTDAGSAVNPGGSAPADTVQRTLEVNDLSIHYGGHVALSGVTLEVRQHEIFGVIGPAYAG
jgi:ABC-type transporter Mla maintaining outer membrane lipid asymmetry ATPase subunit MlaF